MLRSPAAATAPLVRPASPQPQALRRVPVAGWAWLEIAARLVPPLLALLVDGPGGAIGTIIFQEAGLFLATRLSGEVGAAFARRLFLAAYALRAVLAIALHVYTVATGGNSYGSRVLDDYSSNLAAEWLVRLANGEGIAIFQGHLHALESPYTYLIAGIYAALGVVPSVPKIANAAFAALTAVLVADLGARTFGTRTGRLAGVGASLLPTLIVWSLLALKETLVVLTIVVALRSLTTLVHAPLRSGSFATSAIAFAAAMALLDTLRHGAFNVLLLLVPLTVVARVALTMSRKRAVLAIAALAVVVAAVLGAARVRAPDTTLGRLTRPDEMSRFMSDRRSFEASQARTNLGEESPAADLSARDPQSLATPAGVAGALGLALLAPAPWQARSAGLAAVAAEMLIWYALLVGAVLVWRRRSRDAAAAALLAVYGLAMWLLLALTEGNLGNLLRHRVMLAPPLLILGLAGLEAGLTRLRLRRG